MGSSMSLRSGAIWSQLQKCRHWHQVVTSFLKTETENPWAIYFCAAW